ncbi:TIGR04222 domain-containing membrane protein [Luedemannella helvata]|uniref:TIGR04222 domain-containing membrane protein n=1 Tax=Luedemannella helvata TaxID=349315 RepID=A0ABN2KNR5_9ACTN
MATTLHVPVIAAPGDTWGISGPDFLKFYAIAAGVLVVGTLVYRLANRVSGGSDRLATPVEVAYLRGGAPLAVTAAMAALRAAGAIGSAAGGVLTTTGPYPSDGSRLDWAVYDAASRQVRQRDLLTDSGVTRALDEVREGLDQAGWRRSEADRARLRMGGILTLLLAGLGVARIIAGVRNDRPVGYLILLTAGLVVVGIILVATVWERTASGNRAIAKATSRNRHLSPSQQPSWTTYGAAGAAMGVALFGASALWAADPAFAQEAEIQRELGTAGSSTAGTSGCGGGSTAGADGCGGGGGGCGGGGCGG